MIKFWYIKAPKWLKNNPHGLVSFLTKTSKTDAERARALIRWIGENIAYDTRFSTTGASADQTAEVVILRGTAVCQGFANVLQLLGG